MAASAKNQSCDAGAIGAAVGEMVGDYLVKQGNESNLSAKEKQDIFNRAKLVAGTVALAVGADVDTAANSAGVAVENNSLKNWEIIFKINNKNETIMCIGTPLQCQPRAGERYSTDAETRQGLIKFGIDIVPLPTGAGYKIVSKVSGKVLGRYTSLKAAQQAVKTYCFVAGTLIETIDGLKPIETIQQGDLVWSRHEETLEYGYRPVTGTFSFDDKEIFEVVVQDSTGNTETFETTEEHPFWVVSAGWLPAKMLQAGMTLVNRDNEQTLKVVSQTKLNKTDTVYNFEVDEFHTYHIGEFGVWVHNSCNLKYEKAPYHGSVGNSIKSKAPTNGQSALEKSLRIKETSDRRISLDKENKEFVVFDKTIDNIYHGHVRNWDELTQEMKNTLIKANLVTRTGKIK